MNTFDAIPSMRKSTLGLAVAAGLSMLLATITLFVGGAVMAAALLLPAVGLGLLACGGRLAQERQHRIETGVQDLFLERNAGRSEAAVRDGAVPLWSSVRRWIARHLFGHKLMVGDIVQVKPLSAIRSALDADGCIDGLPFMEEMAAFCGKPMRVYRVVDKIYDYGRSRLMRRLDGCVLLVGLRCDGSEHAGCEAACYLIWKSAWLEAPGAHAEIFASMAPRAAPGPVETGGCLTCQYTQLTQASRAVEQGTAHGLLGPLVVGNVTWSAFLIAVLTRSFNAVQAWRGGAAYPSKPTPSDDRTIRGEPLSRGDWVRVKSPAEIARAMDKNSKNRGLWFDADMLKHCGRTYQVRGRVEKIIDVGSGKIIPMKTPCIVLEGVHYSGEFQGFGEQHDFLYWREAWLGPAAAP